MTEHGTYAAYQRHRDRGEEPCDACRDANRAYMRRYRDTNGGRTDRRHQYARRQVLAAIRRDAPDYYRRTYREAAEQWERDHPKET